MARRDSSYYRGLVQGLASGLALGLLIASIAMRGGLDLQSFAGHDWFGSGSANNSPDGNGPVDGETYQVHRVIDGDTVLLDGIQKSIRLIGADTPELARYGKPSERYSQVAKDFTTHLIASGGGTVRVELDGPTRDKYQRNLAHLWVGDQEISTELIRAGLADPMLGFPFSNEAKDRYRRAEAEAKAARRGKWK